MSNECSGFISEIIFIKTDLKIKYITVYIYIYINSSYDERIQRRQSAQYRKRRTITVNVTLTSARCDTVFHIRR